MLVSDYADFVRRTDQSIAGNRGGSSIDNALRNDIAIYGLVGEIGSVLSAVKKRLLSEDGPANILHSNEEIREELGDVLWYCFLLHQVIEPNSSKNILIQDISALIKEIGEKSARGLNIRRAINHRSRKRFLAESIAFIAKGDVELGEYQRLAYLTARTKGATLLTVCLSVLWQLGAELLRRKLPPVELKLNTTLPARPQLRILAEVLWHVAALASLYGLSLDDIAEENQRKVSFRLDGDRRTPLHDTKAPPDQRLPRSFEIAFITIGPKRSRMYLEGRQVGDDLTDNAYVEDGYRFHDVMHLANAAVLGWSPVLRGLLGHKRKYKDEIDEVEDGARAKIVEEAVIKAIHSEGVRIAEDRTGPNPPGPLPLFVNGSEITFQFLKFIHNFTKGLEVFDNTYGEWERAIVSGHTTFHQLRIHEQGTVSVNLDTRQITFRPDIVIDLKGTVGGMGSALLDVSDLGAGLLNGADIPELDDGLGGVCGASSPGEIAQLVATKRAIAEALGLTAGEVAWNDIEVTILSEAQVSIRLAGAIREIAWKRGVITFRVTFARTGALLSCHALAICDPQNG